MYGAAVWLLWCMSAMGCAGGPSEEQLIERGRLFFRTVIDDGYACSDCHPGAVPPTDTSRIHAGHALTGVVGRKDWWNSRIRGRHESVSNAALYCYARFQTLELEELEKQYKDSLDGVNPAAVLPDSLTQALTAFLKSFKGVASPPDTLYRFPYPVGSKRAAADYVRTVLTLAPDSAAGAALYSRACAWCHGLDAQGVDGKGQEIKLKPREFAVMIEQVRFGGYRMPFFQQDRVSDQDLRNIVEHLSTLLSRKK